MDKLRAWKEPAKIIGYICLAALLLYFVLIGWSKWQAAHALEQAVRAMEGL